MYRLPDWTSDHYEVLSREEPRLGQQVLTVRMKGVPICWECFIPKDKLEGLQSELNKYVQERIIDAKEFYRGLAQGSTPDSSRIN